MPVPQLGQPGFGVDMKDRFRGGFVANPWFTNFQTANSFSTGAQTLTGAQLIAGIIVGSSNGTGFTYTLPSAASLKTSVAIYADLQGAQVGDTVQTLVVCGGTGAAGVGLFLVAGTGGSFDTNGNQVIPAGQSKYLFIRFSNVTPGSEAYTVYA